MQALFTGLSMEHFFVCHSMETCDCPTPIPRDFHGMTYAKYMCMSNVRFYIAVAETPKISNKGLQRKLGDAFSVVIQFSAQRDSYFFRITPTWRWAFACNTCCVVGM